MSGRHGEPAGCDIVRSVDVGVKGCTERVGVTGRQRGREHSFALDSQFVGGRRWPVCDRGRVMSIPSGDVREVDEEVGWARLRAWVVRQLGAVRFGGSII